MANRILNPNNSCLVALYRGDHSKDGLMARLGYGIIRLGQIGEDNSIYTHCETIFAGDRNLVRMGSASFRDGQQVRITEAKLNPEHWTILQVRVDDLDRVEAWFLDHLELPYSTIGALASATWFFRFSLYVLRILADELNYWCSRAVGESLGLRGAANMSVSELATVLWNLPDTLDVTREFFYPDSFTSYNLPLRPVV